MDEVELAVFRTIEGPFITLPEMSGDCYYRRRIRPVAVQCPYSFDGYNSLFLKYGFNAIPYCIGVDTCPADTYGFATGIAAHPDPEHFLSLGCFHLTFARAINEVSFQLCFVASHGSWEEVAEDIINFPLIPALVAKLEELGPVKGLPYVRGTEANPRPVSAFRLRKEEQHG